MNRKLNILNLAPRLPYPLDDGGKIGIASSVLAFKEAGFTSDFFFYYDDDSQLERLPNFIKEYDLDGITNMLPFKYSLKNSPVRIFKSLLDRKSLFIKKHNPEVVRRFFADLCKQKKYDAILCHHTSMAPLGLFVKSLTDAPVTLRMHNIEHRIWTRYAENLPKLSPKRAYVSFQGNALKREEIELWNKMDVNFPITYAELEDAQELAPKAKFVPSLSGIDTLRWDLPKVEKNPNELLLATTYHWPHNVDALKWFLDNVLPIVHKSAPSVKVTLLGKNVPAWLEDYRALGVDPVGYVEDLDPYFSRASVYFAPLFVGAGIRIKILEAMAASLPVVATPVSAEGNFAKESDGLIVTANPVEFAAKIIDLIQNPIKAQELGAAARRYIVMHHDTRTNMNIITDCLASLVR